MLYILLWNNKELSILPNNRKTNSWIFKSTLILLKTSCISDAGRCCIDRDNSPVQSLNIWLPQIQTICLPWQNFTTFPSGEKDLSLTLNSILPFFFNHGFSKSHAGGILLWRERFWGWALIQRAILPPPPLRPPPLLFKSASQRSHLECRASKWKHIVMPHGLSTRVPQSQPSRKTGNTLQALGASNTCVLLKNCLWTMEE